MKSFFEEYGFVALSAIVVIILIVMATPVGNTIENSLKSVVTKFSTNVESGVDAVTWDLQPTA